MFRRTEEYVFVLANQEGDLIGWSEDAEQMFGYSPDEVKGKDIAILFLPEEREKVRTFSRGRCSWQMSCVRKDGSVFRAHTETLPGYQIDARAVAFAILIRQIRQSGSSEKHLRLLQAIVTGANDAVLVTEASPLEEPGPRITYVNEAFVKMTGYGVDEVIGRDPRFLQGPETDLQTTAQIRAALERGEAIRVELVNYRKDRTTFWVEISIFPVRDTTGKLTHWAAVQRDVTDRHEAEALARKLVREEIAHTEESTARTRLELILESITDGFLAIDRDLRYTYVNRKAAEYHGHARDDLIGKKISEEITDAWASKFECQVKKVVEEQLPVQFEEYRRLTDRWLETRIYPTEEGATAYSHDITERKHAEQALQEANENLSALIQSSPLAIAAIDLEGHVNTWNPAAERMFGWTSAELVGKLYPIIPLLDIYAEAERIKQTAKAGQSTTGLVTECMRKDGTRIPVSLSTALLRAASGERGMLVMLEDITERRKAEEAQERLTAILEATPDIVCTADLEGVLLYLNRAGREMFGLKDAALTRSLLTDLHPDAAANFLLRVAIPAAIKDGSWSGESTIVNTSRKEIPVSQVIIAHRRNHGPVEYLSTVIRDISETRHAAETQQFLLEASRSLAGSLDRAEVLRSFAALLVPRYADYCVINLVAPNGLIEHTATLHVDAKQQTVLDELRRFTGTDRLLGVQRVLRTGETELIPQVTDAWLRAVSQDEHQLRLLRRLAPASELAVSLKARGNIIGTITCAYGISGRAYGQEDVPVLEDLASRAALALDNAELHTETEQAVRTRDEVLRIVAHDLRNPLSTIRLSASLLPGTEDAEKREDQANMIQRAINRANLLIDDLLDAARLQSGAFSLNRQAHDVPSIITEAVETQKALASSKEIAIESQLCDELPLINVDRHRLLQLFSNLIGNAVKFLPEGGHITIRVQQFEKEILFSVMDNGRGIAPDQIPHLFEPFWQATKQRGTGAGLGLTISKGIVEAHGGRIWVESEPGLHTTFYFTIPVALSQDGHERRAA